MYTLGMRGEGDVASPTLTADGLEEVITVQQKILSDVYNTTDLLNVPQTWVLYKVSLWQFSSPVVLRKLTKTFPGSRKVLSSWYEGT